MKTQHIFIWQSHYYAKIITFQAYVSKTCRSQFIDLRSHIKKLEKEEQIKLKARIRKGIVNIRAETEN